MVRGGYFSPFGRLRVRAFHGLSLNIDMDLKPFSYINPCGCAGLQMTQLSECSENWNWQEAKTRLMESLATTLGYKAKLISAEQV